ncbi:PfkB family carbohydrate kinase [Sphingomonas sp.]|uniref:PfkB family carbohydrate kinase n=1 Tax=Sphingomonas sp. TaxID=28214 RepID=UPI0025E0F711|nr:PfkB family carbohydrate kinase [Sphingomonas sp.]MBV9526763.1 hypothetical protein [Sphingomonas sp.]
MADSKPGLVGVGDNVVDHYVDEDLYYPGGNTLNVAVLARRFGLQNSAYIGIVGDDEEGRHVHASLLAEGLSDKNLRIAHGETGKAEVAIVDGDRTFITSNKGGIRQRLMLRMDRNDLALIERFGHVHSSCFSYVEPELVRLRQVSQGLSFDFSTGRDFGYLATVCPTITIAFLSAADLTDDDTEGLIKAVHSIGAPSVCVTQGERGAVFSTGERLIRQGVEQAELVDTMGAGDSFIAAFLASRIDGATVEEAMAQAAKFAAKACGWAGAFGHPHPAGGRRLARHD